MLLGIGALCLIGVLNIVYYEYRFTGKQKKEVDIMKGYRELHK